MGAAQVVVLIGERPGLSVPNSLGVYLTHAPQVGRRDSERNCISNIHADGLSYFAAAELLAWLMNEARRLQLTGVGLKENAAGDGMRSVPPPAAPKALDSAAANLRSSLDCARLRSGDVSGRLRRGACRRRRTHAAAERQ
jgi:hypothetical protein